MCATADGDNVEMAGVAEDTEDTLWRPFLERKRLRRG
jgi:hypothetical protein